MRAMRLLALASLVLCACGSDVATQITCAGPSDQATCIHVLDGGDMGKFLDFDASVAVLPQCCNNVCVVPASGCDFGYRYVTSLPGFGDCVAEPMCPETQDLATPADLSSPDLISVDLTSHD
jgi:hypothetical protein